MKSADCNLHDFLVEKEETFETVRRLILSMCETEEVHGTTAMPGWIQQQRRGRLLPIEQIGGSPNDWDGADRDGVANIPPFQNTRHRYPWICSLRYVISFKIN